VVPAGQYAHALEEYAAAVRHLEAAAAAPRLRTVAAGAAALSALHLGTPGVVGAATDILRKHGLDDPVKMRTLPPIER
jgi:hypothetical protein